MKTIKLIFSIALVALATTACSQNAFFSKENKVEFINATYTIESSKFENLVSDFLSKFSRSEKMQNFEPVVCMSYMIEQADIVYEEVYNTESWMTSPFECSVAEADLVIESWMTVPFEAAESIKMESWMTAAWI